MIDDIFIEDDFSDDVYCWQVKETLSVEDAFPFLKKKDVYCMQCSNYNYCCLINKVKPETIKED